MTSSLKTTKQYALTYLDFGFSVLPLHTAQENNGVIRCSCGNPKCSAPAKHPLAKLVPNGLKDASNDPSLVKGWFRGLGQKNIGIATGAVSGIVVLDVDPHHGGASSLAALEEKYGGLPKTLRWQTGGGGQHILFAHPGGTIRNSVGALGDGLDVRGDGGYIVAPPSRHNSGKYYELLYNVPLDTPLSPPPCWLLKLMRQGSGRKSGLNPDKPPIKKIAQEPVLEGGRNSTITRITGHLFAKRVDSQICLSLMLAFNDKFCTPPLDEEEVARTVASIERLSLKNFKR